MLQVIMPCKNINGLAMRDYIVEPGHAYHVTGSVIMCMMLSSGTVHTNYIILISCMFHYSTVMPSLALPDRFFFYIQTGMV